MATTDSSKTSSKTDTKDGAASDSAKSSARKAEQWDAQKAARTELHNATEATPMYAVLGDDVFEAWAAQLTADERLRLTDENGNPVTDLPQIITQVGPGPNDYLVTRFEGGQILVQDARDITGRLWHFPAANWTRFYARVRGEEPPVNPDDPATQEGPTMFEAAAEQNARTAEQVQADREATAQAEQDSQAGRGQTGQRRAQ